MKMRRGKGQDSPPGFLARPATTTPPNQQYCATLKQERQSNNFRKRWICLVAVQVVSLLLRRSLSRRYIKQGTGCYAKYAPSRRCTNISMGAGHDIRCSTLGPINREPPSPSFCRSRGWSLPESAHPILK